MRVDTEGADLVIVKEFRESSAALFGAWSDPGELARWMGPENVDGPEVAVDLKPQGTYRITICFSEAADYTWGGRYLEIQPPRRLSFTVAHYGENGAFDRSNPTVITVTFDLTPSGTRMTFVQSPFPPNVNRKAHAEGWVEAFDKLGTHFSQADLTSGLVG